MPLRFLFLACLCLAALVALAPSARAQAPAFAAEGALSSDSGHALVEWQADTPVLLEISDTAQFTDPRPVYQGDEGAYFLSGLAGGDYFLRLTDADGQQSSIQELRVTHQSLTQALWLTLVGAIITLAILAVILRGARS